MPGCGCAALLTAGANFRSFCATNRLEVRYFRIQTDMFDECTCSSEGRGKATTLCAEVEHEQVPTQLFWQVPWGISGAGGEGEGARREGSRAHLPDCKPRPDSAYLLTALAKVRVFTPRRDRYLFGKLPVPLPALSFDTQPQAACSIHCHSQITRRFMQRRGLSQASSHLNHQPGPSSAVTRAITNVVCSMSTLHPV